MKICLINHLYTPYNRGGAEKVVLKQINELRDLNHDVVVISTSPIKIATKKEKNLTIYYLKSSFYNLNKKPFCLRLLWHLKQMLCLGKRKQAMKIIKQEKPDLVVTHNLMGIGYGLAKDIQNKKIKHHHFLHDIQLLHPSGLIIYGKENKLNSQIAKLYRNLSQKLIGQPNLVISPSKWLLQVHQNYNFFKKSKTEIRPFTNPKKNTKTDQDTRRYTNSRVTKLLYAGQIETHKGVLFLIKAFIDQASKDMQLEIAGTGSQLKKAKQIAKKDKRIKFLGKLAKDDLEEKMKSSNLLIVPSLCYENSPLIIDEAHKTNLKVIASNIGGIPERTSSSDLLFEPNNAKDLFEKIKR